MFCDEHRPTGGLGDAMPAGGAQCSHCELTTYAGYAFCEACSIQLGRCQVCRVAIRTYASPMMHTKIALWRWQMKGQIQSARAEYEKSVAASTDQAAREAAERKLQQDIARAERRFQETVGVLSSMLTAKEAYRHIKPKRREER
jgi:hypothetical protein